jgi:hypothetical protein
MNSFFTCHIFLEVGKTQDFPSKIWKTLEDALTNVYRYNISHLLKTTLEKSNGY